MGNLANALQEQANIARIPMRCTVGILLRDLTPDDAQALRNAITSKMQGSQISAALRSEGYAIAGPAIQRHRRQQCNCEANA